MNNKEIKNVIFDLDGTLIDSSTSILKSYSGAFSACQINPKKQLNSDIIGPPLQQSLSLLAGTNDKHVLSDLSVAFKSHYDYIAYKETDVFPEVHKMLLDLNARGVNMYIATNKRIYPTDKIISHLKWDSIFQGVYALDSFASLSSKQQVLMKILEIHNIHNNNVVYIGDQLQDYNAAEESNIPFILALWGYNGQINLDCKVIQFPSELYEIIW